MFGSLQRRVAQLPHGAWLALILVVLSGAYSNSFHGPFVFDDVSSIRDNPTLRSWRSAFSPPLESGDTAAGRPLLNASLAANYLTRGLRVGGYHAVNLLIHLLAVGALFGAVRRTLELPRLAVRFGRTSVPRALAVAALWGLHPLDTESVTYVVQRAESLAGLCILGAMYAFVRAVSGATVNRGWVAVTVLSTLAAMATKEIAVMIPILLFLYDRAFVAGTFAGAWRARKRLHTLLAATWLFLAFVVLRAGSRGGTFYLSDPTAWWRYWLTQPGALVHYVRLAALPHPLVFEYGTFWLPFAQAIVPGIAVVAFIAGTAWALVRHPMLGFLGAWVLLLHAPSSLMPGVVQMIVEHRTYLPLIVVVIAFVLGLQRLVGVRALWAVALIALTFGTMTYRRNFDYRSELAIWSDTLAKRPKNTRAWNALGMVYADQGQLPDAERAFLRALKLDPASPAQLVNYGHVLFKQGRKAEAVEYYRKAIAIEPEYHDALSNLGMYLQDIGDVKAAISYFERALSVNPRAWEARYNLGNALVADGRVEDGVVAYRTVLAGKPEAADARKNLANALIQLGRPSEALAAIEAAPQSTLELQVVRAMALLALQKSHEALALTRQLSDKFPNDANVHMTLGLALNAKGDAAGAADAYEVALQLGQTSLAPAVRAGMHASIAEARQAQRRLADALAHYEQAWELQPGDPELAARIAALRRIVAEPKTSSSP